MPGYIAMKKLVRRMIAEEFDILLASGKQVIENTNSLRTMF